MVIQGNVNQDKIEYIDEPQNKGNVDREQPANSELLHITTHLYHKK